MSEPIAIIAGRGALPGLVADTLRARGTGCTVVAIAGFAPEGVAADATLQIERLVPFLQDLVARGIHRVLFAGALQRPRLDPSLFDPATAAEVPRLLPLLQAGDDALLRGVIGLFEDSGIRVLGLADVAPELIPGAGVLGRHQPDTGARADAERAAAIVGALGALDIGQGAVVAGGLCLALESLPGTDAMLEFVVRSGGVQKLAGRAPRGVLYKAPKPDQDRRVDLPAIGPDTVSAAARAGLAGIVFAAGGAVVLERARTVEAADAAGLFLWSRGR